MLPDRIQQAMLNFLFLGRAAKAPDGFGSNPAFQDADGNSRLAPTIYYAGNSQGGIIGGALTAVAQDWQRAFLGVPGMNYSTLLNRSVDFDDFNPFFTGAVPRPARPTSSTCRSSRCSGTAARTTATPTT